MGLLDQFLNPQNSGGLLSAASQVLQASGDPRRPFGFGQAAGLGIEAYQQHNELARRRKLQEEEAAQAQEIRRMQMEAASFNLGRDQKAAAKEDEISALAPQFFRTPEQMAASLPGGPTNENAAQIANMQPGFDINGYADAVMQRDPLKGMAIKQQFAKQAPQVDRVDIATDPQTNRLVRVITFKDGSEKVSPFDPKSDMTEMDLGGVKKWVDKNRIADGQSFARTMTPDAAASNSLGWARMRQDAAQHSDNYGVAKERLGIDRTTAAAKLAVGKAPTEFQGKSAAFGLRATEADKVITELTGKFRPSAINSKTSVETWPLVGGALGAIANAGLSDADQRAEQAQRDFINAVLRQESGAAIGESEFLNARKQYFPQPNDGPEVIAQKSRDRKLAIQGLQTNAGRHALTAPADPAKGGSGWSIRKVD